MNARSEVDSLVKPKLPKGWKFIPYQDNLDTISNVTVMLKQNTIARAPIAPKSQRVVGMTITVIVPTTDAKRAEDQLDDAAMTLSFILDTIPNLVWASAQRAAFTEQNPCYDFAIEYTTQKEAS